ncbi:MAG: ABC transporter permease, partial [Bacteroidaceae bacterium]|nr:ABC transporter permease [Bacteroidaceae bacterium]
MIDIDKWTEILQAITRNKARSFLTAFGIFWGIFMLVLLMGGAKGMRAMLESTFDGFAQNSYMAFAGKTTQPYAGFQVGRTWSFEQRDLETLRQQLPEADVVTGMVAFWGAQYKYRDKKHNGVMKGVYP